MDNDNRLISEDDIDTILMHEFDCTLEEAREMRNDPSFPQPACIAYGDPNAENN